MTQDASPQKLVLTVSSVLDFIESHRMESIGLACFYLLLPVAAAYEMLLGYHASAQENKFFDLDGRQLLGYHASAQKTSFST